MSEEEEVSVVQSDSPVDKRSNPLLKIIGLVLFLLASVMSLLLTEMSQSTYIILVIGIVFVAVSAFVSLEIKFFREVMLIAGVIAILSMNMYTPSQSIMDNNLPITADAGTFFLSLLYTLFLIAGMEFIHADIRISELLRESGGVKDFSVKIIMNSFISRTFPFIIAGTIIATIISHMTLILTIIAPPQLANSLEVHSLYAIAMMAAIIFVPAGIILALVKKPVEEEL